MYQHPRTLTKSGEKHILENRVQFIKAFVELESKDAFPFFARKFHSGNEYQKKMYIRILDFDNYA